MKNLYQLTILLLFLLPAGLPAEDQTPDVNVNERYTVESVEFTGAGADRVGEELRQESQKFVGRKYNAKAAEAFARKVREKLKGRYNILVKVDKGEKPEHVRVIFQMDKAPLNMNSLFKIKGLYHSKQGFSGLLEITPFQNHVTFGIVDEADRLLERNAGYLVRIRQASLGTDFLGFQIDLERYHQSFNYSTIDDLRERPDIPDFYRARQNFAPALVFHPAKDLTLKAGLSFQRLQLQYPSLHTDTAYAGTGDLQYNRYFTLPNGYKQSVDATYELRTATDILDSDYIYTRHMWKADYALFAGKSQLHVHFTGGIIGGTPPLFERFSLGNSTTLRGWNKFDVSPVGGSRMAHGSLEYRYRSLETFYDVGTVWDPGKYNPVRHSFGFGLVFGKDLCISLAFPARLHDVGPIFMIGTRF